VVSASFLFLRVVARSCFLLGLVAASAFAADRYQGPEWAPIAPKVIRAAGEDITPDTLPDCDYATIERKALRVYRVDGTAECQDDISTKLLTEAGRRGSTTISLNYTVPYETIEVSKLEVMKPNGVVVPIDVAANSAESTANESMADNIFDPNARVLTLNVPQLEIGDIVHVIIRLTTTRAIIAGEYEDERVFENRGYIRHASYEIRAPADKPLAHVYLRDPVAGTVTASTSTGEGGTKIYHWEIKRVPRMFDEPNMPEDDAVLQRLLVSTLPNWSTVSQWYWNLSQPHLAAITPEMKARVHAVIADARTDAERMNAVFQHVSNTIRYMGITPERDRPGFEPHDVSLTFERKYGVCRDKAALLVALLREVGFTAYPVLINVGKRLDPDCPSVGFNHAIAAVETKPGEYVLLDPTVENSRELLPAQDENRSYLVCRPEGDTLRLTPTRLPDSNQLLTRTTATLDANGRLEAQSEIIFKGANDQAIRQKLAKSRPDERLQFFESIKNVMPGTVVNSVKVTPDDMFDTSTSVRAVVTYTVPSAVVFGSDKAVLSMPWLGVEPSIMDDVIEGAALDQRKYPLEVAALAAAREEITLRLPDSLGALLSVPQLPRYDDGRLSYERTFTQQGRELIATREMKVETLRFAVSDYPALKEILKQMNDVSRKLPVLAIRPGARMPQPVATPRPEPVRIKSDIQVLEHREELVLQDAHHVVRRFAYAARVLAESGKEKIAELKVAYNPATQSARVLHAAVISSTGKRQDVSADGITVMDQDWNATAKRYTGGKIIIAHFPGIEVGSVVDAEFERTLSDVPIISQFTVFQETNVIEKKSYRITAAPGVPIQTLDTGSPGLVSHTTSVVDGRQVFEWKAENVPALKPESSTPPNWSYLPGFQLFVGDRASYYRELRDTMLERASHAKKAQALARQLAQSAKTRREAVLALRNYVAQSIRSAGPNFTDLPLKQLSNADTTLTDGYGDGADRAILLFAMLRAIGFEPDWVLASDVYDLPPLANTVESFAFPNLFTGGPLVKITLDGAPTYVAIDLYQHLGATKRDGKLGVRLSDQQYEVIHATAESHARTEQDFVLALNDTGGARLTIRQRYYGTQYGERKQFWTELTPEERRRDVEEMVSSVAQGARLVGDLVTDFSGYPGQEEYTVEVDHYATVDGKYLYCDLPFRPGMFSTEASYRWQPLFFDPSSLTVRTEVVLPLGFRRIGIAPGTNTWTSRNGGRVTATTENNPGRWSITYHLDNPAAIMAAAEYPALLDFEAQLESRANRLLLLEAQDSEVTQAGPRIGANGRE
jgi:transglutaminase-like putative cysteine protease